MHLCIACPAAATALVPAWARMYARKCCGDHLQVGRRYIALKLQVEHAEAFCMLSPVTYALTKDTCDRVLLKCPALLCLTHLRLLTVEWLHSYSLSQYVLRLCQHPTSLPVLVSKIVGRLPYSVI